MRKVLFLATALLLATASVALAQATVKAGDIDFQFLTQIENDFEYRDNYDLNDQIPHISGDQRNGLFVESEIRFGWTAKASNWRAHVLFEQEDLWDRNLEGGGSARLGLERAWGEYNFGPFTFQAGPSVLFTLDPAELVYSDDDPMARFYGKTAGVSWQFGWIRRNDDGATAAGATTRLLDQDIIQGSVTFPLKNGGLSLDVTPFILYNHDKTQGPTLDTIYLGVGTRGTIFGVQTLAQFTYLTGTDDTTRNSTTAAIGQGVDVNAWAALLSLAYPIPNTPLTLEVGGVWASGDDDPTDLDAEAFTGVFHDTEVFNSDGIWIDDDIFVQGRNGGTVRVKEDDKHWTTLVPKGITASTGNLEDFNLSHPGIQIYTAALHYKATPNLNLSGIYQHIRTFETIADVQGATGLVPLSDEALGNEIALRAVWKVEKYVTITPQISYFIPSDGLQDIVGQDDSAFNAIVEVLINF